MNIRLAAARLWIPRSARRRALAELAAIVADSFAASVPDDDAANEPDQTQSARRGNSAADGCDPVGHRPSKPPFNARPKETVETFARFTRDRSDRLAANPEQEERVRRSLHRGAVRMGERLRREFRIQNMGQARALVRAAYRAVDIDLRIDPSGEVTVRRCAFARFYSPETCRLISALDEGLMAGILGPGRLEFTGRLTEDCGACHGRFRFEADGR